MLAQVTDHALAESHVVQSIVAAGRAAQLIFPSHAEQVALMHVQQRTSSRNLMASSWLLPWCARSTMSPVCNSDDKAGKSALCQQGHHQVKVGACALRKDDRAEIHGTQLAARTSCPNAVLPLRIRQMLGWVHPRTQQQCATVAPPTRRAHRMCSAWPPQAAVK